MGVRRILGSGAALLALAPMAPSSVAAFTPIDLPVSTSGALVYTWHGDPARGCAGAGVCGIQGTLIVRVQGPSDMFLFANRRGALNFGSSAATVRVRRTEAASQGDCIDTSGWPASEGGQVTVTWNAGGRAHLVVPSDGPSSGRCAGPLAGDLPSVVNGQRAHGRFAFIATRSWAAGPYSGTLQSTVRIRPASRSGSSSVSEPPSSRSPGPVPRTVLDERVSVTYRIDAAPGTLTVRLRGQSDPLCAALDSCGTTGALSIALAQRQGTLTLEADRLVSRRVSRARALADFRAGRLSVALPGPGLMRTFTVGETLARPGGATCTDISARPTQSITWLGSPFIGPGPRARVRSVPLVMETMFPSFTFLRTRCPGPFGTDVFGDNELMAQGRLGVASLLARHSSVVLTPPAAFGAPGYAGTLSGKLDLRLSRVKVVAGTIKVPA